MKNVTILLAVAAMLALAAPVSGATYYWAANVAGDWDDGTKWSTGVAPPFGESCARVYQGDSAVCSIDLAVSMTQEIRCGYRSSGEIKLLTDGSVSTGALYVGYETNAATPSIGKFTHEDGSNTAKYIRIGNQGSDTRPGNGIYTITGGSINQVAAGDFKLGHSTNKGVGVFRVEGISPTLISLSGAFDCASGTGTAGGSDYLSTLQIKLDTSATGVRKIGVTGAATFAGELEITRVGDLAATKYVLMSYGSRPGSTVFENVDLSALPGGSGVWSVEYDKGAGSNELWLVPEPATLALLGIGGLGVLIRRRRK